MCFPIWQEPRYFRASQSKSNGQDFGMPEIDLPTIQKLLVAALCLLLVIAILGWRISRRLTHVERLLANGSASNTEEHAPSTAETATGGAFETFLNEDASRRSLPKSEQFSAYRKWRQEKGLNWSGS